MKKNKRKLEDIVHPALKIVLLVFTLLFMGGAIVILYISEDLGLFLGYVGLAAAYLAMFITVIISEMTANELKKKLNKIIKMLEKKKS